MKLPQPNLSTHPNQPKPPFVNGPNRSIRHLLPFPFKYRLIISHYKLVSRSKISLLSLNRLIDRTTCSSIFRLKISRLLLDRSQTQNTNLSIKQKSLVISPFASLFYSGTVERRANFSESPQVPDYQQSTPESLTAED